MAAPSTNLKLIWGTAFIAAKESFWSDESHLLEGFSLLKKHNVTTLDTAQLYNGSEEYLGTVGAGTTHDFVIDTKWIGGFTKNKDLAVQTTEHYLNTAKESIKKLGVPQVDIFYIHAPAYHAPIEPILKGVNEAYKAGLFRRFGLSNFPPAHVQRVYDVAKQQGYVLPSVYQGNYSAVARKLEDDLLPLLRKLGIAFYAYSPIAGGFLTKTREQIEAGESRFAAGIYQDLYAKKSFLEALTEWRSIAQSEGVSPAELAYRWVLHHSALDPKYGDAVIFGASNLKQLEGTLLGCEKGPLGAESAERIQKIWEDVKHDAGRDNYETWSGEKGD